MPDEYQVWHRDAERNRFEKVAVVEGGNVEAAAILTSRSPEHWHEFPQIHPEPGNHRSTEFGDIIINPEGVEFRFEAEVAMGYPGFVEVDLIFQQGYTEFLAERAMEDAYAIGFDPTGVDGYLGRRELAAEIRLDEGAARMRDAGEDYEAMLREAARRPANDNHERGRDR